MSHIESLERMLERALDKRDELEAENKRVLDQLKRTQGYEASLLGDMERLKTVLAARLSRIEELQADLDEANGLIDRAIEWTIGHQNNPVEPWSNIFDDMRKHRETTPEEPEQP